MNRTWLNAQWAHITGGGTPGTNAQAIFENRMDVIGDDLTYPGLRSLATFGLMAGGAALGAQAYAQGGPVNQALGGAILGGMAGGILMSHGSQSFLKSMDAGMVYMETEAGRAAATARRNLYPNARSRVAAWAGGYRHPNMKTRIAAGEMQAMKPNKLVGGLVRIGAPIMGTVMGAALGATIGGAAGAGLSFGAVAGIAGAGVAALYGSKLIANGALNALGKGNIGYGALNLAKTVAGAAWTGVRGAELAARTVLTGGRGGKGASALDSWFPFFRNTQFATKVGTDTVDSVLKDRLISRGMDAAKAAEEATIKAGSVIYNPRKFAPNPRIVRRMVGIPALLAVGAGIQEAMSPQIAPPSAFFDGRHIRHVNDLGTGGEYGMGVLGRNSTLNMNQQDASRMISQMF